MAVRQFGPCDNAAFYRTHLSPPLLLSDLMMKNINLQPFMDNWVDTDIMTMTYLATFGRALILGIPNAEKSQVLSVIMAELIGSYLPFTLSLNQMKSRETLIASVKALISNNTLMGKINPEFNNGSWVALFAQGAVHPMAAPDLTAIYGIPNEDDYGVQNAYAAIRILKYLAITADRAMKRTVLESVANIIVSICKRGTVSNIFATKIENAISIDLRVTVVLNAEAIQLFYQHFASYIDDTNIVDVYRSCVALIPINAIRLRLTAQQLTGTGLTSYITVIRAMIKYHDFKWHMIRNIFRYEWTNFAAAKEAAGDNLYYGLRRDLGPVRSTKYKSLAYVAKELLIRVGGERSLSAYLGWTRRVAYQQRVDALIDAYILKCTSHGEDEDEDEEDEDDPEFSDLFDQMIPDNFPNILGVGA